MGYRLLQPLLVSLNHLLDHLAADGAGFPGGQMTVVTVGQVDANLPWCPFYILKWGLGGFLSGRSKFPDAFRDNLTDELVEDPNALLITGILPGHLHITLW